MFKFNGKTIPIEKLIVTVETHNWLLTITIVSLIHITSSDSWKVVLISTSFDLRVAKYSS